MKEAYINCLKKLREFRKCLNSKNDMKRGKLYFAQIKDKTEKIINEKDENYLYKNIVKYTLPNYRIDKYNYERLTRQLRNIIDNNYILKNNNYVFNNIGNEFGGRHPAIILKNFDSELFVLPISSKKPKKYIKLEQDYNDEKITLEECEEKKSKITEVIQIDNI